MRFQFFDIIKNKNDNRNIKGIILKNGIKMVIISDPDIIKSGCCVGVNAGYLQDDYSGTAHFLEHLLFMGSEKFKKQNDFLNYIISNCGESNAYTSMNSTCYYLNIDSSKFNKAIEMLSWFFKSPLLYEKNIKSEMEIINSEHEKNKNSDMWIIDDIFKNFIKTKKYKNFGTGNNERLKNITYDDIIKFYNKYYTNENTYVCIIDSNTIEDIIKNYVSYFEDIVNKDKKKENSNKENINKEDNNKEDNNKEDSNKENSNKENSNKKNSNKKNSNKDEDMELINDNLIIFKSISKNNFLNIYLILNGRENNQNEYQLIKFINYIIGKEYKKSLCYELLENYNVKSVLSGIEYFLDKQVIINVNMLLIDNDFDNIKNILNCFEKYIEILLNLTYDEFYKLYNNYKSIRDIKSFFKSTNYIDNDDIITVVDNLMKADYSLCLNKKFIVYDINKKVFEKFKNILKKNIIKIITNIGFDNLDNKNISSSKYYNSNYFITNIDYNKKNKYDFNIMNLVLFCDIKIKYTKEEKNIKRDHQVMKINENKILYYFNEIKYGDLCSIIIIRKNTHLLKDENKMKFTIYTLLINKILNYYLHGMTDLKMYFSISCNNDYYILNFNGINKFIKEYIIKISDSIKINNIFEHKKINKYFSEIIKECIDDINNEKYEMPYIYTISCIQKIILKTFSNKKQINFLNNLTINDMKECYNTLFNFEKEYILTDGFNDNEYIINNIFCDGKITENNIKNNKLCIDKFNYEIKKSEIIKTESNNCLCSCYIVENIYLLYDKAGFLNKELYELIIKKNMLYDILSNMISEDLFNVLRTQKRLGYIVKSLFKSYSHKNNLLLVITYLVQSEKEIEIIKDEIKKFNNILKKRINDTKFKYEFEKIKKIKIQELEKFKLNDIYTESGYYKKIIINNTENFNLIALKLNILKKITFDDMITVFKNFIKKTPSYIVYEVN